MSEHKDRYDDATKTYWLLRKYDDPETLVPKDELQSWSSIARTGHTDDQRPVEAVNYVFPDKETAAYNYSALQFADVGTYVGNFQIHEEFTDGEEHSFETKEDFGIS